MKLEELKDQHPEAYQAALTAGATIERERISAINALPAVGHQAIISAAIADGTSGAGDVALAILTAEKTARSGALADMLADAPAAAPAAETSDTSTADAETAAHLAGMVEFAKNAGRA